MNYFPSHKKQAGVALITAVLVVALAATLAVALLAQQSKALSRAERGIGRAQSSLTAAPALDWARAILAEPQSQTYVHRRQTWAQPIIGQPIEGASVAGRLSDESAKFNINNLVTDSGSASTADIALFKRLLSKLGIHESLADSITDWIDIDREPVANTGAEDRYYLGLASPHRTANRRIVQLEELLFVRGVTVETFNRLRPFVTALPKRTRLNLNTVSSEVMSALFVATPEEDIKHFLRAREDDAFIDLNDAKKRFPKLDAATVDQFAGVGSAYFLAELSVTQESSQLRQQALLHRPTGTTKWPLVVWVKAS